MKIFTHKEISWDGKINFVDRNNVVVGLDAHQSCCESFGWILTIGLPKPLEIGYKDPKALEDLDAFVFATTSTPIKDAVGDVYAGGSISFRLVADGKADRYLTLYNYHNGYYSHGFDMKDGDNTVVSGVL